MEIRHPIVAGMFYYASPEHLKEQLTKFFSKAKVKENFKLVIAPHAGYDYSGLTACHAINSLEPISNFIILGPNHTGLGKEFAISSAGIWHTPLGDCEINSEIASKLKECKFLQEDKYAHLQEHSIEVQLPFLQYKFKSFKFVPVCIMNLDYSLEFLEKCESVGKEIAKLIKTEPIGVIASSDFSHYLPINIAKEKDNKAIEKIKNLDIKGFFKTLEEINASVCGYGPIAIAMTVAKELNLAPKIIHNSSSGDVVGDFDSVVTYYAIGFR